MLADTKRDAKRMDEKMHTAKVTKKRKGLKGWFVAACFKWMCMTVGDIHDDYYRWRQRYSKLSGGFDELVESDSEDENEETTRMSLGLIKSTAIDDMYEELRLHGRHLSGQKQEKKGKYLFPWHTLEDSYIFQGELLVRASCKQK